MAVKRKTAPPLNPADSIFRSQGYLDLSVLHEPVWLEPFTARRDLM